MSKLMPSNDELPRFTPTFFSRLTIAETVYHQPGDGDSTSFGKPFNRILKTDEQPYVRTLTVGEEWVDISIGCWLKEASQLIIHNVENRTKLVQWTPEEKELASRRYVELGIQVGAEVIVISRIPPGGESSRLSDPPIDIFRVRSVLGSAKIVIAMVPS